MCAGCNARRAFNRSSPPLPFPLTRRSRARPVDFPSPIIHLRRSYLSQSWLQSERFPHILDRDLAPCTGREVFQFEGTVLNAPEPGHFMAQRLEQSSDFTVFPLGQDHFKM